MSRLRQISTTRLVAVCVALVAVAAGGTAIASGLSASGPLPPSRPLATAIHNALSGSPVQGVTARVQFTNHLVDSASLPGADSLLTGATGRLWLSSDHRLRLELQSKQGDSQLVIDHGSAWFYDASSNTVYRAKLPSGGAEKRKTGAPEPQHGLPSMADIQKRIDTFSRHALVSGATRSNVGGAAAYTVRVSPRHDGGLLGAGELAWDATHGVPLRFAVYAQGNGAPVLELKATQISFGALPTSDFAVSPPSGAKVVEVSQPTGAAARAKAAKARKHHAHAAAAVTGPAAVQAALPFKLSAPATLVGLPRQNVRLIGMGKDPAALVTYGQGLGGIAVLERAAPKASTPGRAAAAGGDGHRASLPTVSIGGATGHELSTALGTLITFTRGAVGYAVVGSVPANAAEAAARGL